MPPRRLEPVDLEYFVTIVGCGSLGAASLLLGVSQPALSKSVRRLEQVVTAPLLERTARGVAPTPMGQLLFEKAGSILAELDATRRSLQELAGGGAGHVALGVSPSVAAGFLPPLTAIAHEQRPGLRIRIVEGLFDDLLPGLQQGRLDLMLSSPMPDLAPPDVHLRSLGGDLFAAFVGPGHPLARPDPIVERELLDHPWVLAPGGGVLRRTLELLFRDRGLPVPVPYVETFSVTYCRRLIADNRFVTFLPLGVVNEEVDAGRIVRVPLPWLQWRRQLFMVTAHVRTLSPATRYLYDLALQMAPELLGQHETGADRFGW